MLKQLKYCLKNYCNMFKFRSLKRVNDINNIKNFKDSEFANVLLDIFKDATCEVYRIHSLIQLKLYSEVKSTLNRAIKSTGKRNHYYVKPIKMYKRIIPRSYEYLKLACSMSEKMSLKTKKYDNYKHCKCKGCSFMYKRRIKTFHNFIPRLEKIDEISENLD